MKANHPANKHLEEYAIKFPFRYIFVMSLAFFGLNDLLYEVLCSVFEKCLYNWFEAYLLRYLIAFGVMVSVVITIKRSAKKES